MNNIFIIKQKTRYHPSTWVMERCKTKKQAFKRWQKLTGFFNLDFKTFIKTFLINKY